MPTKSDVLKEIAESWRRLESALDGLTDSQLTMPGEDGWSSKDQLAHLSAWEASLLALLDGRDRNAVVGLAPTGDNSVTPHDIDAINAAIRERSKGRSASEVVAALHDTHARLVAALDRLRDDDLARPYSYFQPNDLPFNENPVIGWIAGNTYEHYDEHAALINKATSQK